MKRTGAAVATLVLGFVAGLISHPEIANAQLRPVIDLGLVAPTAGTISFGGAPGPLFALNLDVNSVVGLSTPLGDGQQRTCVSCLLSFMTGPFSGHDSTFWYFAPGGSIIVTGGIDLDGDGSIGSGDVPQGTILEGTFADTASVTFVGGSFRVVGGAISDTKASALTDFYGLTSGVVYSGGLNISFSAGGAPPASFTSSVVFSGDVFNMGDIATPPPTPSATNTLQPSATPTETAPPPTDTPEPPTPTATATETDTPGGSPTRTAGTGEGDATPTPTETATDTPTETLTDTPTDTPEVATATPTDTPTLAHTPTQTDTPTPPAVCGNGIVEPGEACDDGNVFSSDGCEPSCTVSQDCDFFRPPGNTFYVNDDTNDGTGTCLTPDFTDIQSAIDSGSVTDGDTILVCPGTYTQPIVVRKELTLRSTDGAAVTVLHTGASVTLDLRRSTTTIDGLTLISDSARAIDANQICPLADPSCASPGARGSNLIISNNVIKDSTEGIGWAGRVDCVDIIDNSFADNGKHILLNHDVNVNGAAILVRILRNTVNRGGMAGMPGITVRGNEAVIADNDIHDAVEDALLVGSAALNVRRNLIERSGDDGIVVESDGIVCVRVPPGGMPRPCLQITENNIYNNTTDGLRVKAGTQTVDTGVHCNNFEDNGTGLGNEATSGLLDATGNWWDSSTGPSGVGPGTGDAIANRSGATTAFVEFLCCPCPAGVPSTNSSCADAVCIAPQIPGHDPDVDPQGRHITLVSTHDLDNDPRTTFGNDEGRNEVYLVSRGYPVTFGDQDCAQAIPPLPRDRCGICVGGTRPLAPCLADADCPGDPTTQAIVNGDCVLVTQITDNPNPIGTSFSPRLSLRAKHLLFESADNIFGLNSIGVPQSFTWNRHTFEDGGPNPLSLLSSGGPGESSLNADQHRFFAVLESQTDPLGSNADHNFEIFMFDARRNNWYQITNTVAPVQNHRPVDRRGRKLLFDSNGDIDNDTKTTFDPANGNGNLDGNREIFMGRRTRKGPVITQLTDSRAPVENRAGGLGYNNRVACFSSNGNYSMQNNDGNFEIFTVFRGTFAQETISTGGDNLNPVINGHGRFIAFESTADLVGDGGTNRRIFLIDREKSTSDPSRIVVLSRPTQGDNQHPRISNGRFIVWDSTVDLTCAPGDPSCDLLLPAGERVVYLYDRSEDN